MEVKTLDVEPKPIPSYTQAWTAWRVALPDI